MQSLPATATFFHSPFLLNHRLRDTIGGMREVEGVPPFDAEMTFADWRIERRFYLHDAIIARADHHLAADTAIRTSGAGPFLRAAEIKNAFVFQRTAWAGIDTRAASDARALAQRRAGIWDNPCRVTTIPNLPHELTLQFIANADTTKASDALRHIHTDVGMRRIRRDAPNERRSPLRRRTP